MLQGVVPFPPEFAERYRDRGYWSDKSLADEFRVVFKRYGDRVALIGGDRAITYAELDRLSDNLALNLLDLGLKDLDRVVVQLPNVVEFVILYFGLQKIGCIPIAALPSQRYAEISQFVKLSAATTCVTPDHQRDFDYAQMASRILKESSVLKRGIIFGTPTPRFSSLAELISKPARLPASALLEKKIVP